MPSGLFTSAPFGFPLMAVTAYAPSLGSKFELHGDAEVWALAAAARQLSAQGVERSWLERDLCMATVGPLKDRHRPAR